VDYIKISLSLLLIFLYLSPCCVNWEKPYARQNPSAAIPEAYDTLQDTLVYPISTTEPAVTTTLLINPEWFKPSPFYERETGYDSIDVSVIGGKAVYIVSFQGKKHLLVNGSLGEGYDSIQGLMELSSKPLFLASQEGRQFIVHDGKRIGAEYDSVDSYQIINGTLAYVARQNSTTFIVYSGKEYGLEYDRADSPSSVAQKLAYKAYKGNKQYVVYDGWETGPYDYVSFPMEINNSLAFYALIGSRSSIYLRGQELGRKYDKVEEAYSEINGGLVYAASLGGKTFIVYSGKEIGREYDYAAGLTSINGTTAYIASKNGKYYVVYDGKALKGYDRVSLPRIVAGRIAYAAAKNGKDIIVYDGSEVGTEYDSVDPSFESVRDTLLYKGLLNGKYAVVYGGDVIGSNYSSVNSFVDVSGRLAYIARKNNLASVIYDGTEISGFERIDSLNQVNGKLIFAAQRNGKWYLLWEK
jgi:hypothetical protein